MTPFHRGQHVLFLGQPGDIRSHVHRLIAPQPDGVYWSASSPGEPAGPDDPVFTFIPVTEDRCVVLTPAQAATILRP